MGIGLVPFFLVEQELQKGHLLIPSDYSLLVKESYYFSYPMDSQKPESLQLLESWLQKAASSSQISSSSYL